MRVFTLSSLRWKSELFVDIFHWHLTLTTRRVERLRQKLKEQRKHMDELDKHL